MELIIAKSSFNILKHHINLINKKLVNPIKKIIWKHIKNDSKIILKIMYNKKNKEYIWTVNLYCHTKKPNIISRANWSQLQSLLVKLREKLKTQIEKQKNKYTI